jgi:Rieske Fe-S protein
LSEGHLSRKRFIRLSAALGLGSVGASVIAGCGGGGGSDGSGGTPKASDVLEGGPKVGKGQAIARESEVGSGSAFPFTNADTGQQSVLVHLEDGEFVAYSAVCTHQACTVAYKDSQLACPCHGSVFDPASGARVLNGPAKRPLPKVAIRVEGGEVIRA